MKVEIDSIGMENAQAIAEQGRAAIVAGDMHIDLSAVRRCDSSAVAVMLEWQRAATARNLKLSVNGAPAGLVSLATVYGVTDLLPTLTVG